MRDSFLEGPHSDELDNMKEDVDFDLLDIDMDEFDTCMKESFDDRVVESNLFEDDDIHF